MEWDDILYLSLLIFSIGIGHYFRKITDVNTKQWIATGIGLILVFIVSGKHIIHPLLCTLVNALIILAGDKRSCHIVSFVFTFAYLLFFRTTTYFGIPYPPAHTNLVQMMLTLKLVGLSFEIHDAAKSKMKEGDPLFKELDSSHINPGFLDICHYTFCYIGVLTGPFYTYRTYYDWLYTPFSNYAPSQDSTLQKLKFVPLFILGYLISTTIYPLQYAQSDEFYNDRSVLYRIWYLTPSFYNFRMRIYIGLVLSECVCTMAGLGAYPAIVEPKPGQGPSKDYKQIASNEESAKREAYNFEAIHNIDPYGSDFVTTFRGGMKCWNMCIQYWLAIFVYKRLPRNQFRTAITMLVSAVWHGVYAGYYLCLCSAPMYLPVEDLYVKLFLKNNTGSTLKIWEFAIWFFKMQAFSYMSIAFMLLHLGATFYYWKSIYFAGHLVAIFLYAIGVYIAKTRKRSEKLSQE